MQYRFEINTVIQFLFLIIIFSFLSCTKFDHDADEKIIVKIGDKTISSNEFIYRAEYTIRPAYCRDNFDLHKKIVLNSLIAEKMLALEAGEKNELEQSERFQRYIQGRKEQAMRQWFYNKEIYERVEIEPEEIDQRFHIAGRKYRIQYFTVRDRETASKITKMLQKNDETFENIYRQLSELDSIPEREIEWNIHGDEVLHDALFTDSLQVDQVIGPVQTENDLFITMKIKGWTENVAITEKQINERLMNIEEKLKQKKAEVLFEEYVGKIMKGKRIVFNPKVFKKMVETFAPIYLISEKLINELFLSSLFNKSLEDSTSNFFELARVIENNRFEPLYEIDGNTYTIFDFIRNLENHPLVFRKKKISAGEFAEQFRLAVVDMVRDKYVTQEAYNKGFDKKANVRRVENMWKDALIALYKKYIYLDKYDIQNQSDLEIIEDFLNPYIDDLQKKYSDNVEIDIKQFDDIVLTRINMFTMQENVPFPIIVPSFPQLTSDPWLDYGKNRQLN